jgi:GH18 family chitinase
LISYTPKSPASTTFPYDQVIQGAYPYLSAILIMAYDYAPGYTYQQDVSNLIKMGVPASKISVGLMPGMDDVGVETSLANITTAAQFVEQNGLQGLMFWDLNRDLENQTGLGASAATTTAWNVFHG